MNVDFPDKLSFLFKPARYKAAYGGQTIAASSSITLQNGATSVAGPGTFRFKADIATVMWQQE